MAKLALTVGGALLGFAIGGPFGAQIGAMVGGMVGNILFAPTVKGPRLTDLTVTASTYGQVIPELYGTMRLGGNLIWTTGLIEKKHKSGGKGGPKSVNYTYSASFAIAFCKGQIDGMTRLWADGKLIAGSKPEDSPTGEIIAMSGILNLTKNKKGKFSYRVYTGDEIQEADSTIVATEGTGNVPGYRGLAYIVFVNMPLEDFGNRIPQITAEISRNIQPAAPWSQLHSDEINYSAPTDGEWGSRGDVDWGNSKFWKYNDGYCIAYDLRTMQELYRVALEPGYTGIAFDDPHLPGDKLAMPTFNPTFSIGGNYFFANTSLGNSGTANIWDANTGADLGRIGHYANAFPASAHPDSSQPFYPEGALIGTWDAVAMWFRTLNTTGQTDIVYHAGNLGSNAVMWTAGRQPVHTIDFGGGAFGGSFTWVAMRGREIAPTLENPIGSSDMLFVKSQWSGTEWQTHLVIVNIKEGAVMLHADSGGGAPFITYNNPLNTETPITLPSFGGVDFRFTNCAYDKSDNGIVFWGDYGANNLGNGGTWAFAKYLIDEGAWRWSWLDTDLDPSLAIGSGITGYTAGQAVGSPADMANQSSLNGGNIGWVRSTLSFTNAAIYTADLTTGNITLANLASPLGAFEEGSFAMNAWDDQTQSVMGAPERIFVTTPGNGVSLQAIVDDVLTRTGALTPGLDWDSSALFPITVRGYVIAREATARDILGQLAGAYFFDGYESDYIIKMKLRGSEPIGNITEKHLGFVSGHDITLKETRAQEMELPMRVTVTYSDFDRDYQDGTQAAKRNTDPFPTMHSHNETKFELPIAMTATDAKRIAEKSLKMAWASRWNYKMKLPWEFLKYDPTDVLTVTMNDGAVFQMRLDKTDLGVDFTLDTDALSEKPAAYVSTAIGDSGTGVPTQVINVGGPCDLFMLNTPLLRDIDDTQGQSSLYYVSAKARSPGDFIACYIFEATDASATEFDDIDIVSTEPTWGTVLTKLPTHYDYALDTTTVVTVRIGSLDADLNSDVLESCTYDELLGGSKNAAMVGDEIIQFMTATPLGNGVYELTGILRARRGTNYATQNHTIGDRFILLQTDGSIMKEYNDPSEWEKTHTFKAVASGTYTEDVPGMAVAMEPNDLRPYTPECVAGSDNGTNITITFERRSRITNELHDGDVLVPYKEGQGSLAHFVYKVYGNKFLADKPWADGTTPAFTGTVPIYSGVTFAPLTFSFAKAGLSEFVVELYEVGFVDGFKKYVQFVNVSGTEWDRTDLY